MSNLIKLVFGKNEQSNIVSVEPLDDQTLLFLETPQGIEQKAVPNRYWLLASNPLGQKSFKLAGNQFFQFGHQFPSREQFEAVKNKYRSHKDNLYSIWNAKEQFLVKDGYSYYKGIELKDVSILSFDIETTGLDPHSPDAKVLLISNTYRKGSLVIKKLFAYDDYESELLMLESWDRWVRDRNPSILCGHNIISYDLPYLHTRARYFDGYLRLGRDSSKLYFDRYDSRLRKDQTQFLLYKKPHIFGREIIDTYFLSLKYDVVLKKYDSYGLKQIIEKEGLENKNRTFYDASQIRNNYKISHEWNKIKAYCIDDSDDSLKLFDLMAPSYFYSARSVPKSFQEIICGATGAQINSIMVRSYLQDGHSIPKANEVPHFQGAISFGIPGIYTNACRFDFSSMYPSIIRSYKIYPSDKDPKQHLLSIINYLTDERLKNKQLYKGTQQKYYDDLQNCQKTFVNSIYGFMGSPGLNFNYPKGAEEITRIGRELLNKTVEWASSKSIDYWIKDENGNLQDTEQENE